MLFFYILSNFLKVFQLVLKQKVTVFTCSVAITFWYNFIVYRILKLFFILFLFCHDDLAWDRTSILFCCSVLCEINFHEFLEGCKVQSSIFNFIHCLDPLGTDQISFWDFILSFPTPLLSGPSFFSHSSFSPVSSWFSSQKFLFSVEPYPRKGF